MQTVTRVACAEICANLHWNIVRFAPVYMENLFSFALHTITLKFALVGTTEISAAEVVYMV